MTEPVHEPDPAATPGATTPEEDAPTVVPDDPHAPAAKLPERRYSDGPPQGGRGPMPGVHTRSALTMPAAEVPAALGAQGLETRRVLDRDGRPLELRVGEGDDGGTFEGYACVWGVTDAYGTTFARGCFSAGGLDDEPYALLWMHDPWQVLGVFTAVEDDHGLKIAGRWDQTPEGQAARAKAASGSAPELSVGFVPVMVDPDDEQLFTSTRLVETSQITRRMAAVPGAAITGSRAQVERGRPGEDTPSVPDPALQAARARLLLTEAPVR